MDHQLSEKKLILLYIINEKENIKSSALYDYVIFRGYMDYFQVQNYLDELEETQLIMKLEEGGEVYYTSLPKGEMVIEMFRSRIDHSIREQIRDYVQQSEIGPESPLMEVDAVIEKLDDGRFRVRCKIRDYDFTLMEFVRIVMDEETANTVRNAWKKKGMSFYWNIFKELN